MFKKTFCLFLLVVVSAGCSQRVLLFKRLGSSQKEMQKYVTRQEKGFLRLKQDIERNLLQKGISRERVIKKYGEPVFCDPAESVTPTHQIASGATAEGGTPTHQIASGATAEGGTPTHQIASGAIAESQILQSCLYRSPTEYFSADKAYLYFDRQELLHSWKYEPAE
jgi:hypothetical protein